MDKTISLDTLKRLVVDPLKRLIDKKIEQVSVQSDWDETDENSMSYIQHKPDEEDALEIAAELNLVNPVTDADGAILTDENGNILDI